MYIYYCLEIIIYCLFIYFFVHMFIILCSFILLWFTSYYMLSSTILAVRILLTLGFLSTYLTARLVHSFLAGKSPFLLWWGFSGITPGFAPVFTLYSPYWINYHEIWLLASFPHWWHLIIYLCSLHHPCATTKCQWLHAISNIISSLYLKLKLSKTELFVFPSFTNLNYLIFLFKCVVLP